MQFLFSFHSQFVKNIVKFLVWMRDAFSTCPSVLVLDVNSFSDDATVVLVLARNSESQPRGGGGEGVNKVSHGKLSAARFEPQSFNILIFIEMVRFPYT